MDSRQKCPMLAVMDTDRLLWYDLGMNVSLTKKQKRFIEQAIDGGRYYSSAEVVRAGLRMLMEKEESREAQLEQLRNGIRLGLEQLDRGEVVNADEAIRVIREKLQGRKEAEGV